MHHANLSGVLLGVTELPEQPQGYRKNWNPYLAIWGLAVAKKRVKHHAKYFGGSVGGN